jgi:mannose-6-phosphate isomerase-like protein (cupin superfamily)
MKGTGRIVFATLICLAVPVMVMAQEGPPPPEKTSPFKGNLFELQQQQPLAYDENISSIPLSKNATTSTSLIQVREGVKTHYHAQHDEVVYILSGKGVMTVGSERKVIQAGDLIVIKRGTTHSVVNKSPQPLTALSVMSPPFDGTDRIYTE